MEWNKSLATGVEEFDKMYPVLIENVEAILRLLASSRTVTDYRRHVEAIKMEFINLFSYQEVMMMQQKYPQYYQHKHHHEQFIDKLDDIASQFSSDYFGSTTAAQVENVIKNWFMQHIFMYDKIWGQYTTGDLGKSKKKE